MNRAQVLSIAAAIQAARAMLLDAGSEYGPAASRLIDVLVEIHRAARWQSDELEQLGDIASRVLLEVCFPDLLDQTR